MGRGGFGTGGMRSVKDTTILYICSARASLVKLYEVTIQYRSVNSSTWCELEEVTHNSIITEPTSHQKRTL